MVKALTWHVRDVGSSLHGSIFIKSSYDHTVVQMHRCQKRKSFIIFCIVYNILIVGYEGDGTDPNMMQHCAKYYQSAEKEP